MRELRKLRDLIVYRDPAYYCGPGPSAVRLADGSIVVAFRRVQSWLDEGVSGHLHPSTEACLVTSTDNGATWSAPRVFAAGHLTNQNLTLLADGSLVCLTQRQEAVPLAVYERLKERHRFAVDRRFGWVTARKGVQALRSTDLGRTWGGPAFLSPIPGIEPIFPSWSSPAGLRAPAVALDDGTVGVAVYGTIGVERGSSDVWFFASANGGATWAPRGRITQDADRALYFNETAVYQCMSGRLVAFMRVEQDPDRYLHTAVSNDRGQTWSRPRRETVRGFPYHAARLTSGSVLLAYGYRFDPMGVRARLLDPECEEIGGASELVLRDDGKSSDLGYPHVLPLPDGTALVTYYHDSGDGTRHIAATLIGEQ